MLRNSPKVGKDREELVRHVPLASSKAVVNLQSDGRQAYEEKP